MMFKETLKCPYIILQNTSTHLNDTKTTHVAMNKIQEGPQK